MQPTIACSICIGLPDESVVDYVQQSDCVALATISTHSPFEFAPVELLKGGYRGESIGLLVNSTTRRRLAADETCRVLLLRSGRDQSWRSLGVVSRAYETVIRRIALVADHWLVGKGRQRRMEFFLRLFGHDDPQIRELAYLEMGRAPYAVIKQLGRIAPRHHYRSYLSNRQYIEWRSLAILLLAQSGQMADQRYLLDSFHAAERFGVKTNLSAWATAAIELQGTKAVEFIERQYLSNTNRSAEEVEAVLRALSVHGSVNKLKLRQRILSSYRVLLENHPKLAQLVVPDLSDWEQYDFTGMLSRILMHGELPDVQGKRLLREYLREAKTQTTLAIAHE